MRVMAVALLVIVGCSEKKEPTGRGTSATTLRAAYNDNAVAAAERYEGRPIEVWGKVKKVERDTLQLIAGENGIDAVKCHFESKHKDSFSRLRAGQTVSIKGQVTGVKFGDVHMDDCEIID